MSKRKIVLLMHNGGRLGNQLWLIAAIYAFCLEKGYDFDIRCFFDYQGYYTIKSKSVLSNMIARFYSLLLRSGFKESSIRIIFYEAFTIWSDIFALIHRKKVVFDVDAKSQNTLKIFIWKRYNFLMSYFRKKKNEYIYSKKNTQTLIYFEPSIVEPHNPLAVSFEKYAGTPIGNTLYLYGWLFRNPLGITRYHDQIVQFMTPKNSIVEKVNAYINKLKSDYKLIVGVHVRLGDVVNGFIENNRIAFSESEVYRILKEYLVFSTLKTEDVCFVICSDGNIDPQQFSDLNIFITKNNPAEDLWLLSRTQVIIGADSSFAITASYIGNIPFIVFKRDKIDWEYYKNKVGFFENKYVERSIY